MSKKALHRWEIPRPPEDEVQSYLDMGWYELTDAATGKPILKWSYARGTPQFPESSEFLIPRPAEKPPQLH